MLLREPGPLPLSGTCQPWRSRRRKERESSRKRSESLNRVFSTAPLLQYPPMGLMDA